MQASVRRLALVPLGAARSGLIRGALLSPAARLLPPSTRTLLSETGEWEKDYKTETRRKVEEWWHPRIMAQWRKDELKESSEKKKFYVLSMFPYPSGRLHMGHVRVYTISDTIGHFQRMRGHQVLNPMGWDAFGLPAENAAIERGLDPEEWTKSNIQSMREQLDSLGLCFNWDREVTTCLPDYYRWTQYLFVKLFEAGLAYQKEAVVNWDPVDQTVLADEQVDENGRSWRSGALVEQKLLTQWFIKTTNYAKPLLDALADLPEWYGVKAMQANWIGECTGCYFDFKLKVNGEDTGETLSAYSSSPESVFGAAYLSVLPSHRLLHGSSAVRSALEKSFQPGRDSLTEVTAHNLFTGHEVPLVISHKEVFDAYLDTVIGIPDCSEEDLSVARALNLSWTTVLKSDEEGNQTLINSDEFSGLSREQAFDSITQKAREQKTGGHLTSSKLRDWLISRQRYWGTPIPVVHCGSCGPVAVPEEELPVTLPKLPSLKGKGASPLEEAHDWVNCKCPRCKGPARRETDTMDTFVDSAWYYFRYTDPHNTDRYRRLSASLKVWPLIRPWTSSFRKGSLKEMETEVTEEASVVQVHDSMLLPSDVNVHRKPVIRELPLKRPGEEEQGIAAIPAGDIHSSIISIGREYKFQKAHIIALLKPGKDPSAPKNFRPISLLSHTYKPDALPGVLRWQSRLWQLVTKLRGARQLADPPSPSLLKKKELAETKKIWSNKNYAIEEVTSHFTEEFLFNAAISRLMGLTNTLSSATVRVVQHSVEFEEALAALVMMTAPMAPHLASELWAGLCQVENPLSPILQRGGDVLQQVWPTVDPEYLEVPDFVELSVLINNKACGTVTVPLQVSKDSKRVQQLILESPLVQKHLGGRSIKRAILSPRTALVNLLIDE
ncbi:leucine--tRNA ligase, mitochondrial [Notothenia coriiceps]|uniref:leucine--tRNA ligase n=1 Tax=Notothenia coriiceps TaxID=8208 RepID=A0A6I9PYB4_9TELE|nr:PREDICTED: probable leucine--tRNA ligase, mitochondrial [Notothenia coriiceps]